MDKRPAWSEAADVALRAIAEEHGQRGWGTISSRLNEQLQATDPDEPHRTGKECREHFDHWKRCIAREAAAEAAAAAGEAGEMVDAIVFNSAKAVCRRCGQSLPAAARTPPGH